MFQPSIRTATAADAEAVNDIHNHYVAHSTATFAIEPMSVDDRRSWITERSVAHPVTVAEIEGVVVGFGSLSAFRPRPAYRHTAELSFYVHHDRHRRGIGGALLRDLIERARRLGYHALIGGCCSEATASMALMEVTGFERVACFREVGFKFDRWLDVLFYQRMLAPADERAGKESSES